MILRSPGYYRRKAAKLAARRPMNLPERRNTGIQEMAACVRAGDTEAAKRIGRAMDADEKRGRDGPN